MSSKELTARVRLDTTQAEQKLNNLVDKINKVNNAVNKSSGNGQGFEKVANQTNRVANNVDRANRSVTPLMRQSSTWANVIQRVGNYYTKIHTLGSNIRNKVSEWAENQKKVNNYARSTNSIFNSVWGKLRGIAATYLGIMGMRAVVQTSDTITSAENKLNYINANSLGEAGTNSDGSYSNATFQATQEAMDKMYTSAQKVRMAYTDMMANVSKSMTLAGDAFQDNIDNAIRFQEVMAEAYAVGGASDAEMSSSMYQMIQALGSGRLQGDELRSVREGAPLAYKAIEKFAQGVYSTEESLKDLASQGKITSDIVIAAILNAGNEMDSAFAQTKQTFAQTWTQIKNVAKKSFEPVAHMLRDTLNEAIDDGLISKLENVFVTVSKVIQIITKVVITAFEWIADNWDTVKNIIVAGLLVLAGMWIWQAGIAVASFVSMLMAMTPIQWMMLIILAAVLSLIYVFYLWKTAAIDTCQAIVAALMIVGAALLLIGLIIGSIPMLVIAAVLLILGVLFMFFEQVCGIGWAILTFIVNVIQTLLNVIVTVIAVIIALVFDLCILISNAVMGVLHVIGAVCTNIEIAFSNAWNGAKAAFWDFIADCLDGLKDLEAPINAIAKALGAEGFSLSGLTESVRGRAAAARSNMRERVDVGDAWNEGFNTHEYINFDDLASQTMSTFGTGLEDWSWQNAYNTGANWGAGVKGSINEWASKFQNQANENGGLLDNLAEKLGLDFGEVFPDGTGVDGSGYDPSKALDGISDDTGKIADSMDLTQEDLEYLRRLADMEWKKEYTTAEIKVEMNNTNQINGEGDLDGIVTKLADKLYEELNVVANGVYAY